MPITLHCANCGYNLTGVCSAAQQTGACPECGTAFEYEELVRHGGMVFPPIRGPLLWLLVPPAAAGGVCLLVLMMQASANYAGDEWITSAMWLAGLILLGGLFLSVFAARRLARRVAARPPGSGANLSSTTLTIVFAFLFTTAQIVLAGGLFFFGCIGVVMTMGF